MTDCASEEALRRLPRCERSDLPRLTCACCDSFTMTAEERDYLKGRLGTPTHHTIPMTAKQFDYPTRRRPANGDGTVEDALVGDWAVGLPSVIVCDHGHSDDVFLCSLCSGEFEKTLGDVPALVLDLDLAVTKQVSFLQQGVPLEADPDESVLPYHRAASKALTGLWRAFSGDPVPQSRKLLYSFADVMRQPDVAMTAGRITAAVAHAHRVIDRPPTPMHYGPCPTCHEDIKQERVSDPGAFIRCPCGYHATLQNHQRTCLDAGADRWLSLTELVSTLTQGGKPITRTQIEYMIQREGLQRREEAIPKWRDGRLVGEQIWTYRLGDVMDVMEEREGLSTQQVANRLEVSPAAIRKIVERGLLTPIRAGAKPLRFHEAVVEAYEQSKTA